MSFFGGGGVKVQPAERSRFLNVLVSKKKKKKKTMVSKNPIPTFPDAGLTGTPEDGIAKPSSQEIRDREMKHRPRRNRNDSDKNAPEKVLGETKYGDDFHIPMIGGEQNRNTGDMLTRQLEQLAALQADADEWDEMDAKLQDKQRRARLRMGRERREVMKARDEVMELREEAMKARKARDNAPRDTQ